MFENLIPFILAAASTTRTSLWGWISLSALWVCKGVIQGGCSKYAEYLVDSYCVKHGKEKKYDICKQHFDWSDKILGPVDWIELKSPLIETPFSLNLRGSNVTDQNLLDHLVGQKLLRDLDLAYCEDITYKGVRKFKKLRPDCRVHHNCLRFWNILVGLLICGLTTIKLVIEVF